LPRAHSERLGRLDISNWKNLEVKRNIARIDPAIREVVSLLNSKGYRTFSSCSGGHRMSRRRRIDDPRHESGYLAFSPPSKAAFALYLALRGKDRDFEFEAQAVILDGDEISHETLSTRFYWQLLDQRRHALKYYTVLFAQMKHAAEQLPRATADHRRIVESLFGRERIPRGLRIVNRQMKRFDMR
jgi:hypothetical protein